MQKLKIFNFGLLFCIFIFGFWVICPAQDADLEFILDVTSNTVPLPKIFSPNIDLSGRGFNNNATWPQGLAAEEVLDKWNNEIGFSGIYRLQYNLWDINQLAKEKDARSQLLANYEKVIKKINDAGGIVILNIFGTPAGLGKVLDKKSPPRDLRAFKELVKKHIRNLSCNKKYNVWYEVWSAPDLDEFFLGRRQEYLNLYRVVAEAIRELETETKMHIPLGGPSVSWWFQNVDGNTIVAPEKSLIYELIKFCYGHRLPLDFISWHAYSTSPNIEQELTSYKKTAINLIRDWLSYFHFDRNTPLIIDEWNYDDGLNLSSSRKGNSFISASYIPGRIKNMHKAGLDYQLYFCLEDFFNKDEGVVRNVGIFSFEADNPEYKGAAKATYNVFRCLNSLGSEMFQPSVKINDEFLGIIATRKADEIAVLIYNYIDQDIARSYLSKNIAALNDAERKVLLNLVKADKIDKIIRREINISGLRLRSRVDALLKKAQELNDKAKKLGSSERNVKINIKNLQGYYLYKRYVIDSSCAAGCEFIPAEEKQAPAADFLQQALSVKPYSVNMIILKPTKEPVKEPEIISAPEDNQAAPEQATADEASQEKAVPAEASAPSQ